MGLKGIDAEGRDFRFPVHVLKIQKIFSYSYFDVFHFTRSAATPLEMAG